jgi:hypothetical protein
MCAFQGPLSLLTISVPTFMYLIKVYVPTFIDFVLLFDSFFERNDIWVLQIVLIFQSFTIRFVACARQLAKALEVPLVNDLGYTKRYVRCLQVHFYMNLFLSSVLDFYIQQI